MRIPVGNRTDLIEGKFTRRHIDELDKDIVLFETKEGEIHAVDDICPHYSPRATVRLSRVGEYLPDIDAVNCLHTCFFLADGKPADKNIPRTHFYPVEQDADGFLQLVLPDKSKGFLSKVLSDISPEEPSERHSWLQNILARLRRK